MSKPTDINLCEMIYEGKTFEDKCQLWVPSAYFGTFSQRPLETIAHLSLYQILESEGLSYLSLFWDKIQNLTFVFRIAAQEESHG
jgi:hypothetical protein